MPRNPMSKIRCSTFPHRARDRSMAWSLRNFTGRWCYDIIEQQKSQPYSNLPASQLTCERSLSVQAFGICMCLSMLLVTNHTHILPWLQEHHIGPSMPRSQQLAPPARPVPFWFLEPCYVRSNTCGQALWSCLFDKASHRLSGRQAYWHAIWNSICTPFPVVDNLPLAADKKILTPCSDRPMNQLLCSPYTARDGKLERLQMWQVPAWNSSSDSFVSLGSTGSNSDNYLGNKPTYRNLDLLKQAMINIPASSRWSPTDP